MATHTHTNTRTNTYVCVCVILLLYLVLLFWFIFLHLSVFFISLVLIVIWVKQNILNKNSHFSNILQSVLSQNKPNECNTFTTNQWMTLQAIVTFKYILKNPLTVKQNQKKTNSDIHIKKKKNLKAHTHSHLILICIYSIVF